MPLNSADFPGLHSGNHQVRRPPNKQYNCIAWTAGRDDECWEAAESHDPEVEFYWPDGVPRDDRATSLIVAFESVGFLICADGMVVEGIEKIAIYAHGDTYEHAARQLETGKWTSKIGKLEVIEHDAPEDLSGPAYGQIVKYMQRKRLVNA